MLPPNADELRHALEAALQHLERLRSPLSLEDCQAAAAAAIEFAEMVGLPGDGDLAALAR